jgi:hypothetical protein
MKNYIKKKLNEELKLIEALKLKSWGEYVKLVSKAYQEAPEFDANVVKHWNALNESNHKLFKRLISKVDVIFVTNDKSMVGSINISGKEYPIEYVSGDPYPNQSEMKADVEKNGVLKISIDYSDHPIFSLEDNVVFRTVHDYIVHILGNTQFGAKGEIASYNLHAKLVPREAVPAIFTEVVGQACVAVDTGSFPVQKIALLKGFDYYDVGKVEGYDVEDKELVKNK